MAHEDEEHLEDDGNIESTYLTFQVAGEEYAVPVAYVTEIVRLQKAFSIPDVPPYIRGVINLRGKVITLLDVRNRFGLPETPYTDRTVVVVLDVGEVAIGLIVDAVSEVTEIPPSQLEPTHRSGSRERGGMVKGTGKRAAGVSFVLDVHALLGIEPGELQVAADATAPNSQP